ncbi:hypothetical protein EV175_005415 [Coemansia sp. RSA 1933]|nr:hypothetical protein EV175_005415 [Coemansia sp. RSA 1933]
MELGVPSDKAGVPRIGPGTMGINADDLVKVLNHAIDIGCTFWDTANIYGLRHNERLLSRVLKERRSEASLCTKFGVLTSEGGDDFKGAFVQRVTGVSGKPDYVRKCVEESLERLGVHTIDLYYMHRMDPSTPIEETIAAMAEQVNEGKVKYIGLSECKADDLRHAYAVHPIAAVQVLYSPWATHIETNGLLDACCNLGVTVVVRSPFCTGALSNTVISANLLPDNGIRRHSIQSQKDKLQSASNLMEAFDIVAEEHDCTPSQVALAWLLAKDNVIPIPGTKQIKVQSIKIPSWK